MIEAKEKFLQMVSTLILPRAGTHNTCCQQCTYKNAHHKPGFHFHFLSLLLLLLVFRTNKKPKRATNASINCFRDRGGGRADPWEIDFLKKSRQIPVPWVNIACQIPALAIKKYSKSPQSISRFLPII